MSKRYNLLVFDWDGTIMDSLGHIVACVQHAAEQLELPKPNDKAIHQLIGLNLMEMFKRLYPDAEMSVLEYFHDHYMAHFLSLKMTDEHLYADVKATLANLHKQGYVLAVATGKGRRGLDAVLAETGLEQFFTMTRTADETASKPSPNMLLEIMTETGMEKSQTLMIGDSTYDLEMANNAEVDAVAVTCGTQCEETLTEYNPVVCLADISKLPQWLEEN
tara:strand:+ start:89927 stop:90583 length:657 start_codon:yes stop_codon:yes gene_type:complete